MISNLTMEEYQVCKANDAKKQVEADDKLIQDYIKSHDLKAQKTADGLYYVITQQGTGPMPMVGRKVKVNYTGKLLNGNIFDSSLNPGRTPFEFPLGQNKVIHGWDEGVALLPVGTKATLLIPSALGYGDHGMGASIPANAVLIFDIEVLGVDDKPQVSNEDEIKNYIKANNLNAQRTASGLYYIVDQQGSGAKPQAGKVVTVNYTGKLLDGTIFDSSLNPGREPFTFTLGVGQVISGWDEGIALFNVGGKGTLIIPSNLGYGEQGAGGSIPPNAVLIFEIEVVAAN
ncbi:MAG TPA: peptidylprolyl isomerase [Bacteroidetes bacterium]|nr:peptidylprolyl isomerase [Bacteroidota bacterium]